MSKNNNLKIVNLLHDITQLGYQVYFSSDLNNMVTVGIQDEFFDSGVLMHYHCGYPDSPRERLEEDIIRALVKVKETLEAKEDEKK